MGAPGATRSAEKLAPGDERFPKQLAKLASSSQCGDLPLPQGMIFLELLLCRTLFPRGSNPPSPLLHSTNGKEDSNSKKWKRGHGTEGMGPPPRGTRKITVREENPSRPGAQDQQHEMQPSPPHAQIQPPHPWGW